MSSDWSINLVYKSTGCVNCYIWVASPLIIMWFSAVTISLIKSGFKNETKLKSHSKLESLVRILLWATPRAKKRNVVSLHFIQYMDGRTEYSRVQNCLVTLVAIISLKENVTCLSKSSKVDTVYLWLVDTLCSNTGFVLHIRNAYILTKKQY